MKDAYSFDADDEKTRLSYRAMVVAYARIFARLGFDYRVVEADSGAMGGTSSHEFQILCDAGEDAIVACSECSYAANVEAALGERVDAEPSVTRTSVPSSSIVDTPGKHTIEEVSGFLGVPPCDLIKTLIYVWGDQSVVVLLRGDDDVNEVKLARAVGAQEVFLAGETDVQRITGAPVGFAGPVGLKARILADRHVADVRDGVTGANEADRHLRHVLPGRDFEAEYLDLRAVRSGDACPRCQKPLRVFRGIEAGHTFILGTHYSEKMKATFLGEDGQSHPFVMGCYGIGVSRLVAAAIEQHHDEKGIRWPVPIAPYTVALLAIGADPAIGVCTDEIFRTLQSAGIDTLYDDREERPGVKFMDADRRVRVVQEGNARMGRVHDGANQEQHPLTNRGVPVPRIATAACHTAAASQQAVLRRLGCRSECGKCSARSAVRTAVREMKLAPISRRRLLGVIRLAEEDGCEALQIHEVANQWRQPVIIATARLPAASAPASAPSEPRQLPVLRRPHDPRPVHRLPGPGAPPLRDARHPVRRPAPRRAQGAG